MQETESDPFRPTPFRHRRVPYANDSPPVPIEHSPQRKLTVQDQLEWKVPPCISNWKNIKGYTIPLHMRLSADGRYLRDATISQKFPGFAESLYTAEKIAREEIEERASLQKTLQIKQVLEKEQQMNKEVDKLKIRSRSRSPVQKDKNRQKFIQYKTIEREMRLKKGKRNDETKKEENIDNRLFNNQQKQKIYEESDSGSEEEEQS